MSEQERCLMRFHIGRPLGSTSTTERVVCPDCGLKFHDRQSGNRSEIIAKPWIDAAPEVAG